MREQYRKWKLTKDGRYIVLSNELASANYIEIVKPPMAITRCFLYDFEGRVKSSGTFWGHSCEKDAVVSIAAHFVVS